MILHFFSSFQSKKIRRFSPAGFSLIEVLVSITIGSLIMATAMTAYGTFAKTSHQIETSEKLIRQTNFALIRIIDRARNYRIDYARYRAKNYNPSTSQTLYLISPTGDQIEFVFTKEHNLTMNGEPLFSPEFSVESGSFSIIPNENPFGENLENLENYRQPKLTINNLTVISSRLPQLKTQLQTTISSRLYQ